MTTTRMPNINQVALSGCVCNDPSLRLMDNGAPRLTAQIAVRRSYRDRNQDWQERTSYFDIVLWQKSAETFDKRLKNGTPVFVTGRLESHIWRDEQGQAHNRVQVQVRNLQVLGKEDEDA